MSKEYEIKTKLVYARAITTAKNDDFFGLLLEKCYLWGGGN